MQPIHQSVNQETYLQLLELKEKLSVFQTVSCRLMHEQVQEIMDDSITDYADLERLMVRRKGFCNPAMRRTWLGCAHTMANDTFARLSDCVHATGILHTDTIPSIGFNDLVVEIYRIDHEKGRMEKRKALAQKQNDTAELINIADSMQDIIYRHQCCIKQLEQMRSDLMCQIDMAIANH